MLTRLHVFSSPFRKTPFCLYHVSAFSTWASFGCQFCPSVPVFLFVQSDTTKTQLLTSKSEIRAVTENCRLESICMPLVFTLSSSLDVYFFFFFFYLTYCFFRSVQAFIKAQVSLKRPDVEV